MLRKARPRRPSAGTVLGALALIVAAAGGGFAVAQSSQPQTVVACQSNKMLFLADPATNQCPAGQTRVELATTSYTGFLGATAKAADADRFDGEDSADFARVSDLKTLEMRVLCHPDAAHLSGPPPNATYLIGTEHDDEFDDDAIEAGNVVICGLGGNDVVRKDLKKGDIFLGGEGDDQAWHVRGGTFEGGAGSDAVPLELVAGGTFDGGQGEDSVLILNGATFNGGEGNDYVESLYESGTFNGDAGCDRVGVDFGGTFNQGEPCPES